MQENKQPKGEQIANLNANNGEINQDTNIEIIQPRKRFLILYNTIYENQSLSALEIAILIKGLTAAPDYKITREKLIKRFKISTLTLEKSLKKLKQEGFLMITRQGKNGSKWTFSQLPILNIESENKEQNDLFVKLYKNIEKITIERLKALYNMGALTSGQVNKLLEHLYNVVNAQWIDTEKAPKIIKVDNPLLIKKMIKKQEERQLKQDEEELIKIASYNWVDGKPRKTKDENPNETIDDIIKTMDF